jgi:hypothetical protein
MCGLSTETRSPTDVCQGRQSPRILNQGVRPPFGTLFAKREKGKRQVQRASPARFATPTARNLWDHAAGTAPL